MRELASRLQKGHLRSVAVVSRVLVRVDPLGVRHMIEQVAAWLTQYRTCLRTQYTPVARRAPRVGPSPALSAQHDRRGRALTVDPVFLVEPLNACRSKGSGGAAMSVVYFLAAEDSLDSSAGEGHGEELADGQDGAEHERSEWRDEVLLCHVRMTVRRTPISTYQPRA